MARKHRRRRRRRGSLGPLLRVLSVLLMAVAIVAALTLFFKVNQVSVSGNERYSAQEIIEVSGVEQGDNLILMDKYRIAEKLYTKLPYITEVRINRQFPDTLLVEVVETKAVAVIKGGSSNWLMDSNGKLLEVIGSAATKQYLSLEGLSAVDPAISGKLKLSEESPISTDRLLELLSELAQRDMLGKVSKLDASDPDQLVFSYDDRFQVEMLYDADFDFKLNCLQAAVAQLEPNESGTIRMTLKDDNEVRFIPDQG